MQGRTGCRPGRRSARRTGGIGRSCSRTPGAMRSIGAGSSSAPRSWPCDSRVDTSALRQTGPCAWTPVPWPPDASGRNTRTTSAFRRPERVGDGRSGPTLRVGWPGSRVRSRAPETTVDTPATGGDSGGSPLRNFHPPGSGDNGGYPCNSGGRSPRMETTAEALGSQLTEEDREVSLALVLTEAGTRTAVRLCGISIRVPDRIWYERQPGARFTGWLAKLGLLGRIRVWRALVRSARYRRHADERSRAIREFSASREGERPVGEEAATGGTAGIR